MRLVYTIPVATFVTTLTVGVDPQAISCSRSLMITSIAPSAKTPSNIIVALALEVLRCIVLWKKNAIGRIKSITSSTRMIIIAAPSRA